MNYKIKNGMIVDPTQNLDLVQKDLYIKNGKLVSHFDDSDKYKEIDCEKMVVMAGGIDLHTHMYIYSSIYIYIHSSSFPTAPSPSGTGP